MSEKANPRQTGLFVIGALVLVVAAVLALSSGQWFKQHDRFVAFFDGSVKGLQVGAPVTFSGVQIGEVKAVYAIFAGEGSQAPADDLDIRIEVVFDLDTSVIHDPFQLTRPFRDWDTWQLAEWAAERGFVASLATQSLLTGLMYIDLEIRPGEQHALTGLSTRYPEFPTRKTGLAKIQERLTVLVDEISRLPVEEIGEEFVATLQAMRRLAESPEIPEAFAGINATMDDFGTMARNIDEELIVLLSRLEAAAEATRNAMVQTGATMEGMQEATGERSRCPGKTDELRIRRSR